jgi:hypothetical protein
VRSELAALSLPPGSQVSATIPHFALGSFHGLQVSRPTWNYIQRSQYAVVSRTPSAIESWLIEHRPPDTSVDRLMNVPPELRGVLFRRDLARSGPRVLFVTELIAPLSHTRSIVRFSVVVDRYPSKPSSDLIAPGYKKVVITRCVGVKTNCHDVTLANENKINVLREILNEQFVAPRREICPSFYVVPTYIDFFRKNDRSPSLVAVVELGGCGTIEIQRTSTPSGPAMAIGVRFTQRVNALVGHSVISY